ncbi:MBL fold metallo-hydrolase [Qipengyuania zhejiangensis]|uniref:MBL fold metallo-hydrolase n=1 Tax=Qipengyuania zhejiangensis TaxID=3077782 RepID=UPI002D78C4E2|nr:MBL fold metallo-hydrolase [Qipengyuania sp. Z2]
MKRALVIGGVILLGAVFWFNQQAAGQFVFDRAVKSAVGRDASAELPDGIHAYLCGSGSPLPDADRAGPCIAVLAGKDAFVFDAGSGAIRKLGRMGFPMEKLAAGFLTHLHSDHLDGLGELMLQAWMAGGRDTPLPVYGPPGTEQVLAGFMQAYAIDREYRIAHHGPAVARPGGFGGVARILDPSKGNIAWQANGVTIRVIAVDHRPVDHSYAYRIEYGGRALVISGDTKRSDELAAFAKGADVMFHEALNPAMVGQIGSALAAHGNADGAKIMADIPDYHASPEEAAEVAQAAGVKALVLYHLVPAPPIALVGKAFLGKAEDQFEGDLRLGNDGMLVSLPTRGEAVEFDDLL